MLDRKVFDGQAERGTSPGLSPGSSPGLRLGRVRWTVCAMLFVATSINYLKTRTKEK
jgi:hypothetical protein